MLDTVISQLHKCAHYIFQRSLSAKREMIHFTYFQCKAHVREDDSMAARG